MPDILLGSTANAFMLMLAGASMVSEAHSFGSDLVNQPFELTALEVALKEICQSYAASEKQLEALINPACDALLKKVSEPSSCLLSESSPDASRENNACMCSRCCIPLFRGYTRPVAPALVDLSCP